MQPSIALPHWINGSKSLIRKVLLAWESPFWSVPLSFFIYLLCASHLGPVLGQSTTPFFNYLADAFLHKHFALRLIPPEIHDLVRYKGQYYLYWPPFPAVVILPFVAIWGVGFSDIFFTVVLGAVNIGLLAALLRQANKNGVVSLTPAQRAILVLFFAFGTAYVTLVPRGRVWFTAQVIGITFVLLAYLAAIAFKGWKAFFFTGLALACAFLTRNNLLFTGIWPAYYLLKQNLPQGWRRLASLSLLAALPIVVAGIAFLFYNYHRFGSPFDVGLNYHQMAGIFTSDYHRYGAFNLHYVPTNFYYQYVFYPLPLREHEESWMGGSLFLLSPLFFAAFWAPWADPSRRGSQLALLVSILLTNIPILLLMGTGWVQYGPRYTLDFSVPLLFLTAMGFRKWPLVLIGLLAFLSILSYIPGVLIPFP